MVGNLARSGDLRTARVTEAMLAVPRHSFVEGESLRASYENRPLATEFGQTISQPTVVAIMTEALELTGRERVLEIGTGSGYQTAILSLLASKVFSLEAIASAGPVSARPAGAARLRERRGAPGGRLRRLARRGAVRSRHRHRGAVRPSRPSSSRSSTKEASSSPPSDRRRPAGARSRPEDAGTSSTPSSSGRSGSSRWSRERRRTRGDADTLGCPLSPTVIPTQRVS